MYKEYSWNTGWTGGNAQKVGQELEIIEKATDLTAVNVVEYARTHTDSELYSILEWDNDVAGELWRRKQASQIITNIRVQIIEDDDTPKNAKPIRAYVQTTEARTYDPIEVVVKDPDKYQVMLEKAYRELNRTKDKYADLSEIQELLADVPDLLEELTK